MGNIYLNKLELFLELQIQDDVILDTIVPHNDGAPPHFVHILRVYLKRSSQGDE